MKLMFKMKIVSKRQVTIPHSLLDLLGIHEGDYLEILYDSEKGNTMRGLTLQPPFPFPEQVRRKLEQRDKEIGRGEYEEVRGDLSNLSAKRAQAGSA